MKPKVSNYFLHIYQRASLKIFVSHRDLWTVFIPQALHKKQDWVWQIFSDPWGSWWQFDEDNHSRFSKNANNHINAITLALSLLSSWDSSKKQIISVLNHRSDYSLEQSTRPVPLRWIEKLIPYTQKCLRLSIKILSEGLRKAELDFPKHIFTWYTAKCPVRCDSLEWGEQNAHPGRIGGGEGQGREQGE